jgi:hypothetical protein
VPAIYRADSFAERPYSCTVAKQVKLKPEAAAASDQLRELEKRFGGAIATALIEPVCPLVPVHCSVRACARAKFVARLCGCSQRTGDCAAVGTVRCATRARILHARFRRTNRSFVLLNRHLLGPVPIQD